MATDNVLGEMMKTMPNAEEQECIELGDVSEETKGGVLGGFWDGSGWIKLSP